MDKLHPLQTMPLLSQLIQHMPPAGILFMISAAFQSNKPQDLAGLGGPARWENRNTMTLFRQAKEKPRLKAKLI